MMQFPYHNLKALAIITQYYRYFGEDFDLEGKQKLERRKNIVLKTLFLLGLPNYTFITFSLSVSPWGRFLDLMKFFSLSNASFSSALLPLPWYLYLPSIILTYSPIIPEQSLIPKCPYQCHAIFSIFLRHRLVQSMYYRRSYLLNYAKLF